VIMAPKKSLRFIAHCRIGSTASSRINLPAQESRIVPRWRTHLALSRSNFS
jgi:hypothetical protein